MKKEVAMNDDTYVYEEKVQISLCVLQSEKKASLPPSRVNSKSHLNSTRKSTFPNQKRLEIHHQTTSFFKSASAPNPTSSSSPLLNIPFLPTSNPSRILKYTSSTKPLFSAAAASSSRIPRIPGPAEGNVKKDFARWMWRARKKREVLMLGVFLEREGDGPSERRIRQVWKRPGWG